MSQILIAEDDPAIREGLEAALQSDGHETRTAANGVEAMARIAERRPDLLLLDVMMPTKSGWDVCAEVRRADPSLPIVFLTAKSEEGDKVLGLGLGADDYIVKPFGVRELLARVRAALRRAATVSGAADPAAEAGGDFDFAGGRVDVREPAFRRPDGPAEPLTPRELALLRFFASHPGQALPRERLLAAGWGVAYYGTTRTLDQHVANLRRKLGPGGAAVETVHGVGYRYRAPEDRPPANVRVD